MTEPNTELPPLVQPWATNIAPTVWAVQLTDDADWEAVAAWVGGTVESSRDATDEYQSCITIPREGGGSPQVAHEDCWVIRNEAGGRIVAEPTFVDSGVVAEMRARQLAAELAVFRERDALTRKALQAEGDGPLQFLALRVRQERDRATAERDEARTRLRGMARRVGDWRRTSAGHYADFYHAAQERQRDDERLFAENQRLATELAEWRSGARRRTWPVVEAVPDGVAYAAHLVRAQGTEGGEEHDRLLREAAQRLKALHDAAQLLLHGRAVLEWLHAEAVWQREQALATAARFSVLHLDEARAHDATIRCWREAMAERDEALAALEKQQATLAEAVVIPEDARSEIRDVISNPALQKLKREQTEGQRETFTSWGARAVLKLMESWRVFGAASEASQRKECS